jgi:hypothetical protein
MDICNYRLLEDRPSARALSKALAGFQEAFSLVFQSLTAGPMKRRYLPKRALQATDLRVAYNFPGSFGVALVAPRDYLLFEEWPTKSDKAIDIVFNIVQSKSSSAVAQVAHQLGTASIAALYDWAKDNAQNQTGADVDWNPDRDGPRILVQYPEFAELSRSIEETSEELTVTDDFHGILVGADTKSRRFHFVTDADHDMRGKFVDAISDSQKAQLPAKYIATMRVNTKTNFATGDEEISYDLLKLTPISAA